MEYIELIERLNTVPVGHAGLLTQASNAIEALQARVTELDEGAHQDGLLRVRYGQQFDALKAERDTAQAELAKLRSEVKAQLKQVRAEALEEAAMRVEIWDEVFKTNDTFSSAIRKLKGEDL